MADSIKSPAPFALAMTVSDGVWQNHMTGQYTVLGTITRLYATTFPTTCPQLAVYAVLSGGRGRLSMQVQIIDLGDPAEAKLPKEEIVEAEFPDPVEVVEVSRTIDNLIFPDAGAYAVQLVYDGHVVVERRISVVQIT